MVKLHALPELGIDGTLAQFFRRDYWIKMDIVASQRTRRSAKMGSHKLIPRRRDFEPILARGKLQQ
jgi:hypothetical protein